MRVEVIMPQMGESIVEGTVVSWLREVGDRVKRDEDIFTISTDKVDADIPSPAEGLLDEILVGVGDTVEVGTVVAYIETDTKAAGKDKKPRAAVASPTPPAVSVPETAKPAAPVRVGETQAPLGDDANDGNDGNDVPSAEEMRRTRSTPLVRRIAREHGIQDLSMVPGSGVSGRVTKRDIQDFVARAERITAGAPAAATAAQAEAEPGTVARAARGAAAPGPLMAGEGPRLHVFDDDRIEPMSRMRKSIAEHMVMSRRVSPHVQTVWECDWSKASRARDHLKSEMEARGVKLTYTAFLVQAAARALRAHPILNASADGDRIVYRGSINVGVAVALDDGLIVPVVKRADEYSLAGVARAVNDVSTRAREKRLKPEDVEGGTFTITNPGIFGSLFGVPIINQPQVAILGVGAIKKTLLVNDDDSIRIAPVSILCLSFDHRVVDGAAADRFMQTLVGHLESFELPEGGAA